MSATVCLAANTLYYPQGGGHRWAYLNWALGFRALGCRVIWLEAVEPERGDGPALAGLAALRRDLEPFGLERAVALTTPSGAPLPAALDGAAADADAAARDADMLLSTRYDLAPALLARFRRTALLDLDPGLLQLWMSDGQLAVARHDVHFSTSDAVGRAGARFPDGGVAWHALAPCVALDWWPAEPTAPGAPFTTVSHWGTWDEWVTGPDGASYLNDKQQGFAPYLDLPAQAPVPLELALGLAPGQAADRADLERRGWRVRHAHEVASTALRYRDYIRRSAGELSAAKPSCARLENAWISDRTVCYLASAKPAIVQWTGDSPLLDADAGLLRFRDPDEAARALETVARQPDRHRRAARALAEERFGARDRAARALEIALALEPTRA